MTQRFYWLFLIVNTYSILTAFGQDGYVFSIKTENAGSFDVFAVKDKDGLIEKYTSHLNAPVCEDRVCYNVVLDYNWNAIGEFTNFLINPKEPLTKLDHDPFLPEDYEKLQRILTSQDLNFVNIPEDELVTKNPDSLDVDGYTGATKATVKKEVIEGALYTCYTLWHIANGAVVDSIKKHTLNNMNQPLIKKLIQDPSQTVHYFLINNLNESQFKESIEPILGLMTTSKGYFSKNAIEKIPQSLFKLKAVQEFVSSNYLELDYYTQLAILKKLNKLELNQELQGFFIHQINEKNSFQNQKLIALVLQGIEKPIFEQIIAQIKKNEIAVTDENKDTINALFIKFGMTASRIKQI